MERIGVGVQHRVHEANGRLPRGDPLLVDAVEDGSEDRRRGRGAADEDRRAVVDDQDIVSDGGRVRVTTPAPVVGKQTAAPIGTWYDEVWKTATQGAAYTNSVYSVLSRELASSEGTAINFMPEPTTGPTYGDEL